MWRNKTLEDHHNTKDLSANTIVVPGLSNPNHTIYDFFQFEYLNEIDTNLAIRTKLN